MGHVHETFVAVEKQWSKCYIFLCVSVWMCVGAAVVEYLRGLSRV